MEACTLYVANIPKHYGEADVADSFAESELPVPYKVVFRLGYGPTKPGIQFGMAYFNLRADVDFILEQNALCKSLVTWSDGEYAVLKAARPKASHTFAKMQTATPPASPTIRVKHSGPGVIIVRPKAGVLRISNLRPPPPPPPPPPM